jgi:hypothetical protein
LDVWIEPPGLNLWIPRHPHESFSGFLGTQSRWCRREYTCSKIDIPMCGPFPVSHGGCFSNHGGQGCSTRASIHPCQTPDRRLGFADSNISSPDTFLRSRSNFLLFPPSSKDRNNDDLPSTRFNGLSLTLLANPSLAAHYVVPVFPYLLAIRHKQMRPTPCLLR